MKRSERKNLNQISGRRITALLAAVAMLLSSCGSLAEYHSSTWESKPLLVSESYKLPLEEVDDDGVQTEPEDGDPDATADPDATVDPDATPDPDAAPDPDASAEPEETEEPTPEPEPTEDLSALYPAGTLTYAGNGYSLTATFPTEARIPAGSSLGATEPDELAFYEYIDALQNRLNSQNPDAPWQDFISDVIFLNPVFTDAEGNTVIPENGVVLTVQYDGAPAQIYRLGGRTEELAEDANTAEINDYTVGMIAIFHTEKTQVGYDVLEYRGNDYKVTVGYAPDAGFPADVQLKVREIMPGTAEYRQYNNQTEAMLDENWEQVEEFARYFDITFENGAGEKIEPKAYIDVEILFDDVIDVAEESIDVQAIHFNEETGIEVIKSETDSNEAAANNSDAIDTVSFSSDTFSVYAVVRTSKMTEKFITKRGWTYQITVTYGEEAQIPSDAKLQIREILPGTEEYELYRSQTAAALESDDVQTPGMFDITIVDGEGNEVEPKAPVDVNITLLRTTINQAEELHVVHFKEEATTTAEEGKAESEILENDVDGNSVTFKTGSFSVYVLAYTVNFEYMGRSYEMLGNSEILLSKLLEVLETGVTLSDITGVSYTGTSVELTETDNNDCLIKIIPNADEQSVLTINTADKVIEIEVAATGKESVDLGDAVISSADGVYLPNDATGSIEYAGAHEEVISLIQESTAEAAAAEPAAEPETTEQAEAPALEPAEQAEALADAEEKNEEKKTEETATASQTFYQVYDINLENVDAENYESGFQVEMKLSEEVQGNDIHLYHVHDGQVTEITEFELVGDSLSFVTENFSYFVLSYTVDFHYEGIDYSIEGNSQILLSELIQILNIRVDKHESDEEVRPDADTDSEKEGEEKKGTENEEKGETEAEEKDTTEGELLNVVDVASVTFTNEHLVSVEEVNGIISYNGSENVDVGEKDFLLTSLEPFTSDEKLTITLTDGTVIVVGVTDAQNPPHYTVMVNDNNAGYVTIRQGTGSSATYTDYSSYTEDTSLYDAGYAFYNAVPANSKDGYDFQYWIRDDGAAPVVISNNQLRGTNGATTYNVLDRDTTYVAFFAPTGKKIVRVNWPASGGGVGVKEGGPAPRSVTTPTNYQFLYYYTSDNVTITATSYDNYVFVGWYDGDTLVSTSSELDVKTLKANYSLTPVFEPDEGHRDYYHVWFDGSNGLYGGDMSSARTLYSYISGGTVVGSTSTYQAVDKNNNTINLPTSAELPANAAKTHYELQGWYDIYNKQYYSKGAQVKITADSVFYADWFPTSYNFGGGDAINSTDTSSFITTYVYDYNNLFNMESIKLTSNSQINSAGNYEYWEMNGNSTDFIFMTAHTGSGRSINPYNRASEGWNCNQDSRTTDLYGSVAPISRLFSTSSNILGQRYVGQGNYLYTYDASTGYYYYDSSRNAASYSNGRFYVHSYTNQTSANGSSDDFLPFNSGSGTFNEDDGSTNYWFGMQSKINFFLPNNTGYVDEDGKTGNRSIKGDEMVYRFSGDDDVWVVVDGNQLLLDLGGVHGKISGEINFSTGVVKVGTQTSTFSLPWGEHTLTLYYLERGTSQSNCSIYFNIAPKYNLRIIKKDAATGTGLGGAEFGIYSDPECTQSANLQGLYDNTAHETFTTGDDGLKHCKGLIAGHTYYLKELTAPSGYPDVLDQIITLILKSDGSARVETTSGISASVSTSAFDHMIILSAYNTENPIKVKLRKYVPASNSPSTKVRNIQGIRFKIYPTLEDYQNKTNAIDLGATDVYFDEETNEYITDSVGKFYEGTINPGTYYLEETQVPYGIVKQTSVIKITIGYDKQQQKVYYSINDGNKIYKNSSNDYNDIEIPNEIATGSVSITKTWFDDTGATAVLLTMGRIANNVDDGAIDPSAFTVSGGDVYTYNNVKYIRIQKNGTTWPTVTVSGLPMLKAVRDSSAEAVYEYHYYVTEFAYINASNQVVETTSDDFGWTPIYSGTNSTELLDKVTVLAKAATDTPDQLTVNNSETVETVDIGVSKLWRNNNGTDMTEGMPASATFKLKRYYTYEAQSSSGNNGGGETGTCTVYLKSQDGIITYDTKTNVPIGSTITFSVVIRSWHATEGEKLTFSAGSVTGELTLANVVEDRTYTSIAIPVNGNLTINLQKKGNTEINQWNSNPGDSFKTTPYINEPITASGTSNNTETVITTIEDEAFNSSNQTLTLPISGNWFGSFTNLPKKGTVTIGGEEKEVYYYYHVEEQGVNTALWTVTDENNAGLNESGTITVTNTSTLIPTGSVKLNKTFTGVAASQIPTSYQITATWNGHDYVLPRSYPAGFILGEGNLDNYPVDTGFGATLYGPYTKEYWEACGNTEEINAKPDYSWVIDGLPVGTVVSFNEQNGDIDGKDWTATVVNGDGSTAEGKTATATSSETQQTAAFTNAYTNVGTLTLNKTVDANSDEPVNGDMTKTNGYYTFTITGPTNPVTEEAYSKVVTIKAVTSGSSTVYTYIVSDDILVDASKNLWNDANAAAVPAAGVALTELEIGTYEIVEAEPVLMNALDADTGMYLQNIEVEGGGEGTTANKAERKATVVISADTTIEAPSATFNNIIEPNIISVDKLVLDINDSSINSNASSVLDYTWGYSADYDVNDEVPFRVDINLPSEAYRSESTYTLAINDVMENMTYSSGRVYAYVKSDSESTGTWYDVTDCFTMPSAGVSTIEISKNLKDVSTNKKVSDWSNVDTHNKLYPYTYPVPVAEGDSFDSNDIRVLEFRYKAILTENAEIGKNGNDNTVTVTYTAGSGIEGTKTAKNRVYTYQLKVNKQDHESQALEGASFQLYKKYNNAASVLGAKANDTASITSNGISIHDNDRLDGITLDLEPLNGKTSGDFFYVGDATVSGAVFTWDRIDDGVYMLIETEAPEGFILPATPTLITVTVNHDETNKALPAISGSVSTWPTEVSADFDGSKDLYPCVVTLTNEPLGSLKITKKVTVNGVAWTNSSESPADGTYTFVIKDENDEAAEGMVDDTPLVEGKVTITITNGVSETVEVKNLLPGTYTVTEAAENTHGTGLIDAAIGTEEEATGEDEPEEGDTTSDVGDDTTSGEDAGSETPGSGDTAGSDAASEPAVAPSRTITLTVVGGETGDDVAPAGCVTFTNDYSIRNIVVSKAWSNDNDTSWPMNIYSVVVGLYVGDNPVQKNNADYTLELTNGLAEENRTFTELPVYDNTGKEIEYSVKELGVRLTDGAEITPVTGTNLTLTSGSDTVIWQVANGAVENGAATITNSTGRLDVVHVIKNWTDAYGNPVNELGGDVHIQLIRKQPNKVLADQDIEPGKTYVFTIDDYSKYPNAEYYVVETDHKYGDRFSTYFETIYYHQELGETERSRGMNYNTPNESTVHAGGTLYIDNALKRSGAQTVFHKKWIVFGSVNGNFNNGEFYFGQLDGEDTSGTAKYQSSMQLDVQFLCDIYDAQTGQLIKPDQIAARDYNRAARGITQYADDSSLIRVWFATTEHPAEYLVLTNEITKDGKDLRLYYVGNGSDWKWGFLENSGSGQAGIGYDGRLPMYGYLQDDNGNAILDSDGKARLVTYKYYFKEIRIYDGSKHTVDGVSYNWQNPEEVTDKWWKINDKPEGVESLIENRPLGLPVVKSWEGMPGSGRTAVMTKEELYEFDKIGVTLYGRTTMNGTQYTWIQDSLILYRDSGWSDTFKNLERHVENKTVNLVGGGTAVVTGDVVYGLTEDLNPWTYAGRFYITTDTTTGEQVGNLVNIVTPEGKIRIKKSWKDDEDYGNTGVLLKLYYFKNDNETVDFTPDLVRTPTAYGLNAEQFRALNGTSYLYVKKDATEAWTLEIDGLHSKIVTHSNQTSDCYYFIQEVGYVDSYGIAHVIPDEWNVVYSGEKTQTKNYDGNQIPAALPQEEAGSVPTLKVENEASEIPGTLTVTKTVSGDYTTGENEIFEFTVKVGNEFVAAVQQDDQTIYVFSELTETEKKYSVKKDQTITFVNLPDGAYTVTEDEEDAARTGYKLTTTYQIGGETASTTPAAAIVTAGTTTAVTINNEYALGEVQVSKVFRDLPESATLNDFVITASWTVEGQAPETRTLSRTGNLPADVTRTGDGTEGSPYIWTISGLPIGTEVKFVETGYDGVAGYIWSGTVNGEVPENGIMEGTATVSDIETAKVAFVNIYTAGVELPSTGGSGTLIYTVAGLALITLAGVLLTTRKRRNNEG
ncbi:MAG: Cna B-type domain-containing protein [Clostridia bacterium]|nr:Cna B-type domain-containing protein [Clostridia bacterium]